MVSPVVKVARHFTFHPSNYLALSVVFAHAVVAAVLFFISIPAAALVLLLVVLTGSAAYYVLRDARLILDSAWVALSLDAEGVVLTNRKGETWAGKLLRTSVVTPYLVVLNIEINGQRCRGNIALMPDSMDAESFRQLRVTLKWGGGPAV